MNIWLVIAYLIPVGIGFVVAFFVGALNGAFTGDYSSSGALATWNFFKAFMLISIAAIIWPVSLPIAITMGIRDDRKRAKRTAQHEANLAKGFNYGKVFRITDSPEYIRDRFMDGHLIKIVKWDEKESLVQAAETPIPGYPMSYRFFWSVDRMEEV